MTERKFNRRQFGRIGVGATAMAFGVGIRTDSDARNYLGTLFNEDVDHRFINKQALLCANECGDAKIPFSLAFDTGQLPYKLLVPGLSKANYPDVPDGWDWKFIPMLAADGLPPPEPKKPERPKWSREVLLNPVFKGPSDRPLVALTVDDGYFNRDEILQTIVDMNASATFLIIGSVMDSDPNFIIKANNSGRITWGNHTYTHMDLSAKSVDQIQSELGRTEEALKRICGATTIPVMRPPGGSRSNTSIAAAADLGLRTFMWNVSGDAGTQWTSNNPQALVNYYMGLLDAQTNPWGSIVLLHFRTSTSVALPGIIKGIRARGMEPVSFDKLYEGGRV